MSSKLDTIFREKVMKRKMPITNILITQRGLSSNSPTATLVFEGQVCSLFLTLLMLLNVCKLNLYV